MSKYKISLAASEEEKCVMPWVSFLPRCSQLRSYVEVHPCSHNNKGLVSQTMIPLTPPRNAIQETAQPCHANTIYREALSSRLLISSSDDSCELIDLHVLPDNCSLRLVLLVQWYLHDRSFNLPSTYTINELVETLSLHSQP